MSEQNEPGERKMMTGGGHRGGQSGDRPQALRVADLKEYDAVRVCDLDVSFAALTRDHLAAIQRKAS